MVLLELNNGVISYKKDNLLLSVGVSKSLKEILSIKEFNMGYIVVNARYTHGIVEEYIDLDYGLSILGFSNLRNKYFKYVRSEDICVRNL